MGEIICEKQETISFKIKLVNSVNVFNIFFNKTHCILLNFTVYVTPYYRTSIRKKIFTKILINTRYNMLEVLYFLYSNHEFQLIY